MIVKSKISTLTPPISNYTILCFQTDYLFIVAFAKQSVMWICKLSVGNFKEIINLTHISPLGPKITIAGPKYKQAFVK